MSKVLHGVDSGGMPYLLHTAYKVPKTIFYASKFKFLRK